MSVKILAFSSAREMLGFNEKTVETEQSDTAATLFARIAPMWRPDVSIRVAYDGEFAEWDDPIGAVAELAVIPPVSGG